MALTADSHGLVGAGPALLTVEEAAVIARCSVKTVRRAYTTGALTAYRRRGSRAVLLDPGDVRVWLQGQLVHPTVPAVAPQPSRSHGRKLAVARGSLSQQGAVAGRPRFDFSVDALRERRRANGDTYA